MGASGVLPGSGDSSRSVDSIGSNGYAKTSTDAMIYVHVHDQSQEPPSTKPSTKDGTTPDGSSLGGANGDTINVSVTLSGLRALLIARFIEELEVFLQADQIWPSICTLLERLNAIKF